MSTWNVSIFLSIISSQEPLSTTGANVIHYVPSGVVTLVKGETILSEFGWVKYKRGMEGVNKILEDLNKERPSNLLVGIGDFEDTKWYPVETQQMILNSIVDNFGGDPNVIKEVGAFGVKRIGQFKFVLRFMKVKKVAMKMTDNLMVLYRTCRLDVKETGEKEMKISVIGFPDDIVYSKLLEGGIEQLFEYLSVASYNIKANPTTHSEGISSCNYLISWT